MTGCVYSTGEANPTRCGLLHSTALLRQRCGSTAHHLPRASTMLRSLAIVAACAALIAPSFALAQCPDLDANVGGIDANLDGNIDGNVDANLRGGLDARIGLRLPDPPSAGDLRIAADLSAQ